MTDRYNIQNGDSLHLWKDRATFFGKTNGTECAMKKSMTKNMAFFMHTNSTNNAILFNLLLIVTSYNRQLDSGASHWGRFVLSRFRVTRVYR